MRAPMVGVLAVLLTTAGVASCGDDDSESNDVSTISTVATPPELEGYVALTVDEAEALADEEGRAWRIVEEDGEQRPVTLDHNPERLNFVVVGGRVVSVTTG